MFNNYLKLLIVAGWCFLIFIPIVAQAQTDNQTILVQPQVIDAQAKAKDVLEYEIKLINKGENKVSLYAIVVDLPADSPLRIADLYDLSKATSLARWINIKRSETEIEAGEEIVLPLKIEVNLNALPGKYHALVIFARGANQSEAAANSLTANHPRLLINLAVEEEIIEKIQLVKFSTKQRIYFNLPVNFIVEVKNIGNRNLIPSGFIHIYDRRGQEVINLPINKNEAEIPPETAMVYLAKTDKEVGLGKYRAKLFIEYGERNKRDAVEFIDFWVLPFKLTVAVLFGLVVCLILLFIILIKIAQGNKNRPEAGNGIINLKNKKIFN